MQLQKKSKLFSAFLWAFILSTALILPAIIRGDGILYLTNDFSTQQQPFYTLCHEAIRSGNFYSNLTGLGSSLIGSYSFYTLGSPFFLMTLLFPTSFLPYLMGPLLILKFSLSAVTAQLYIRQYVKNESYALLGALLYAFSGYQLFNIFYNHFEDVCVVAPLLLFAMDRAIQGKNRGLFAFAVFINAMVNYVFFVGSVIFCVLYFIIKIIAGDYKLTVKKFFTLVFEAVLGLALSGILVLPAVLSLMGNSRLEGTISGIDTLIFSIPVRYLEIVRAFLFPSGTPHIQPFFTKPTGTCWTSPAIYIPLFGIAPALSLFFKKGNKFLKILLPVSLIFMFVPILNSLFSGLNEDYYARWFYFPALMLALSAAISLEKCETNKKPLSHSSVIVFLLTTIVAIIFLLSPTELKSGETVPFYKAADDIPFTIFYILVALVGQALIFVLLRAELSASMRLSLLSICTAIIILAVGTVNITTMCYCYPDSVNYEEKFIDGCDLFDEQDTSYRIDTTYIHYNAHMWWRRPSMATFNSTISAGEVDFYKNVGYNRFVATLMGEGYFPLRYLFSVKYAFYDITEDSMMPGFTFIGTYNGFRVYENQYYIPMGFTFSHYITEEDLASADPIPLSRLFLKALLLDENQIEKYSHILHRLDIDELLKYEHMVGINAAQNDATTLRQHSGYYFKWNKNGFTSKIKLADENLVFYSVPYDEGFTAYVNGVETEIEKVDGGFMAVLAPKGDNTIEFKFTPKGLKEGTIITIISAATLVGYILLSKHKRKNTADL